MASPLQALTVNTFNITEAKHDKLVANSEQLRILKNYCKQPDVILKEDILRLINAMEANNE